MQRLKRQKLIIIDHQNQKKFNIIFMKYKDSLSYVQRQTDIILKFFKKFIKTYVDNIIIYLRI